MSRRAPNTTDRIASAIVETDDEPWQFHAACIDSPASMNATRPPLVWDALATCASCPVLEQCRQWAEEERDYVGIAGGAVYTSRRRNRRSTVHTLDAATAS